MSTDHRSRLQSLLRELFQFDAADLDFGIYRILNQRRDEIEAFVQRGLLEAVAEELRVLEAGAVEEKRRELEGLAKQVRETLGEAAIDADGRIVEACAQLPLTLRYAETQKEVARATVSLEAEAEIFNHLYTFFSRYYDEGDFVTKRRYSRSEKYAIPYNGEEVLLHWANKDQYYVKTADALSDYAFRIESHGGYRVRFKLAAADTEQGNVKGDKRYFLPVSPPRPRGGGRGGALAEYDPARRELTLFFEYRPLTEAEQTEYGRTRVQEKTIAAERERLLKAAPDTTLRALLATPPAVDKPPLLDLHLTRWTRKATSDFFIHKDLRGFLERELDFYLKNELMRLDDIEAAGAPRVEQYLARLKVIRRLARRIIAFLAQIEDFQKRLFEKPKFVLESHWCVTLDRVPEDLWPAILANERQWEEWERLFSLSPLPAAGDPLTGAGGPGVRADFLRAHPSLTIDTALYDPAFKDALLAALSEREGGLAGQSDGLLIHGENFQALNLLLPTYRERVKCIYIDPPYNSKTSEILYKNTYKHSAWVSLMYDRLAVSRALASCDGTHVIAIDENEQEILGLVVKEVFPAYSIICIAVVHNKKGIQGDYFSYCHEYAYFCVPPGLRKMHQKTIPQAEWEYGNLRNWGSESERSTARNCFYPIYVREGEIMEFGPVCDDDFHPTGSNVLESDGAIAVYPVDSAGVERKWRYARASVESIRHLLRVHATRSGEIQIHKAKNTVQYKTVWDDASYIAGDYGTRLLTEMGIDPGGNLFPKSIFTVVDSIHAVSDGSDLILDFFAGSGTTAHAVINLNREDGGDRKYILVEQGGYFDTVLMPRIRKVVYAADWRDGRPVEGSPGSSHAFQYLRLESYEDTLDNLDLAPGAAPAPGLFPPEHDDYLLGYMLDHETRGQRLNVAAFETPFDYQLRVRRDGVETRAPVDLLETANFLLGLTITARRAFEHQGRTYRAVWGTAREDGASVAVIWRETAGLDLPAEAAFVREVVLAEAAPDRVYLNGDSHLPGARAVEAVFAAGMR